jgi:hypothetical protein
MVVRSLDVKKDPFRPREEDEELLGPEVPYLSAIGALMYLANYTRPDISFFVNLLSRYSSSPTIRHWNEVKHIGCVCFMDVKSFPRISFPWNIIMGIFFQGKCKKSVWMVH